MAQSFGTIADDYARFRPAPHPDAAAWLVPARAELVVDLGAGTGALTALLVEHATEVVAVEPDERMRAVLSGRLGELRALPGSAEEIPVPDGAADAVVGSSMWHWVDEERAIPEVARVLRPGGILGLVWSGPNRADAWVVELLNGGSSLDEEERDALVERRRQRHSVHLPDGSPFDEPETRSFPWTQMMTADELIGLATTYSRTLVMGPDERGAMIEELRAYVQRHPALAGRERIEMPMRSYCWRSRRH